MIEEEYVSFETAKLLKEKGFNEKVICYYDDGGSLKLNKFVEFQCCNEGYGSGVFAAPTLQMAMKWLREVHHVHIGINPVSGKGYHATIYDVADFDDYGIISDTEFFFHAEEACEAALKYCLENLI